MERGWLKIPQASAYAGVHKQTMQKWLKDGLEHSRLPTGRVLIKKAAIDAYLEQFSSNKDAKEIETILASVGL